MSKNKDLILSAISQSNIDLLQTTLTDYITTSKPKQAKRFLYDIISLTTTSLITYDNFTLIFDNLPQPTLTFISSYLVEILWLNSFSFTTYVDAASSSSSSDQQEIKLFSSIVSFFLNKKVITCNHLLEKFEEQTLVQCGIVYNSSVFKSQITRINTEMYYEQQKYNLFREESEGFAKLIVYLLNVIHHRYAECNNVQEKITALIGFFDLDPTRVIDIVIEVYCCNALNENYVNVFNALNVKALPHVIEFKLREKEKNEEHKAQSELETFFVVVAQLIKKKLITLSDVFVYFKPTFEEMEKMYENSNETVLNYCKKELYGRVAGELRTAQMGTSIGGDEGNQTGSGGNSGSNSGSGSSGNKTANYFCNFNEILREVCAKVNGNGNNACKCNNHVVLMLNGLIKVKDKYNVELLFNIISAYYDPLMYTAVIMSLCELLSWVIEPVYRKHSVNPLHHSNNNNNNSNNSNNSSSNDIEMPDINTHDQPEYTQITDIANFYSVVIPILDILSIGLYHDQILFQKLLTILIHNHSLLFNDINNNNKQPHPHLEHLLIYIIFPSFALTDPTPSLVNKLFTLLNVFPYKTRYYFYNEWLLRSYMTHPFLYMKLLTVNQEISKCQKGLSKDNSRQYGRILAIISNSNPILVFDNIIKQLTIYSNQIIFFISSLSFCSSLSFDVISFIICRILSDSTRIKTDAALSDFISPNFKNLVEFIGRFYKKYHNVQMDGVLHYTLMKFINTTSHSINGSVGIEIMVLQEMLDKMTGVQCRDKLMEGNFYCDCGGLYFYLKNLGIEKEFKYFKKPATVLMKFFTQCKDDTAITLSLMVMFMLKKRYIVYNSRDMSSVRMISFYLDLVCSIYQQFVMFLNFYAEKKDLYCKLLLDVKPKWFIEKFHLCPIDVFELYRPTLKAVDELTKEEYEGNVEMFKGVFEEYQQVKKMFLNENFDSEYLVKENIINDVYKSIWEFISPELFYLFNALELKDVFVPVKQYEKEIKKLNEEKDKLISALSAGTTTTVTSGVGTGSDNVGSGVNASVNVNAVQTSTITTTATTNASGVAAATPPNPKSKKQIEKITTLIDSLNKELTSMQTHATKTIQFINSKTDILNSIQKQNKSNLPPYLIQYLLYPRLIRSKHDSLFTVKLLCQLLMLKLPMLNVFDLIQKLYKYILPSILCVTEHEAENIGIFLNELLKTSNTWHEESYWNENCKDNPSFSRKLDTIEIVEYHSSKEAFNGIMSQMVKFFVNIFKSNNEYMNIRNAMSVLRMITVLPASKESTQDLIEALDVAFGKFKEYGGAVLLESYRGMLVAKVEKFNMEKDDSSGNNSAHNKDKVNGDKREKSGSRKRESYKSYSPDKEKEKKKSKRERSREREREKEKEKERNESRKGGNSGGSSSGGGGNNISSGSGGVSNGDKKRSQTHEEYASKKSK